MKTITVTGGAGFIGANVANHHLQKGDRVVVYDTLERKGCIENLSWLRCNPNSRNLEVLVGDVRMPTRAFQEAVERSDALLHLAAQVAVTTSVVDPVTDFEVNALGTFKLLELVRNSSGKRPAVVYASTNKVYGGMENVVVEERDGRYAYRDLEGGVSEDRPLDFHSPYGCSNGCADQYVRDYARIYGLDTVVFRQSCIYGYRQFGIEDQGWVAWFIIATLLKKPLTIYGDGKQVRDVLFVDDLVRAFDMALDEIETTSGQIYNIGGGPENTISLHDLITLLRSSVDPDLAVTYDEWRPGDQPVYVSNIGKARADFGWSPQVDWKTGADKLIGWVKEHQPMLERMF